MTQNAYIKKASEEDDKRKEQIMDKEALREYYQNCPIPKPPKRKRRERNRTAGRTSQTAAATIQASPMQSDTNCFMEIRIGKFPSTTDSRWTYVHPSTSSSMVRWTRPSCRPCRFQGCFRTHWRGQRMSWTGSGKNVSTIGRYLRRSNWAVHRKKRGQTGLI